MKRPFSLSRRALMWLSLLLLLVSLLPLYALAFYNHAFYDDMGFSLLTRDAWSQTGSPFAVLEAAIRNTIGIRNTWEGTYSTSFVSALQPSVFGEGAYWVTTFLLLTVFLLAVWYFLKQTLRGLYGMDKVTLVTVFSILGFVLVQFVPDAAEAFYWFNGGVAYTLLWSVMLVTAGVWLRFERATGRLRCALLFLLLVVLTMLVGGAKYSTVLLSVLLATGHTFWAFTRRRPKRFAYLFLTVLLLACMAFSMVAPGNAVRAKTLGGGMSAPKAILQAVYFGLALLGNGFSLPLAAALLLLILLSIPALKLSPFRFAHPLWVTLIAVCLFCAQLAPTLYTGNYLGDGRVLNTYYYTYVLMLAQLALYWTGHILRKREHGLAPLFIGAPLPEGQEAAPSQTASLSPSGYAPEQRLKAAALMLAGIMLAVGCVAYRPDGAPSYGPQNMASGSALRALVSGQAARYDAAMDTREALLSDPALSEVTLVPVTDAPRNFMGDALSGENLEYVLRLYADYYDKVAVHAAGQGE